MSYVKTTWTDGENKYDIKTQADTVVNANIKLVYVGTGGTPASAANMNNIEGEIYNLSIMQKRKSRMGVRV